MWLSDWVEAEVEWYEDESDGIEEDTPTNPVPAGQRQPHRASRLITLSWCDHHQQPDLGRAHRWSMPKGQEICGLPLLALW